MKTSSKIAIAAAAIGAWLLGRKNKSVSGMAGIPIGAAKKYYVYAGYYELFVSSEPMPAPYILQKTFRSIDRAIEYAESWGDNIVYCENVKYDLPDWLYENLQDNDYEYATIGTGKVERDNNWEEIFIISTDGDQAIRIKKYSYGYDLWVCGKHKYVTGNGYYYEPWFPINDRYYKTIKGAKNAILKYCEMSNMKINKKELEDLSDSDFEF